MTQCQDAYRLGLSCEYGVSDLVQHVYDYLDRDESVVLVSFDPSRAYDTVNSRFASKMLFNMGLRDPIN